MPLFANRHQPRDTGEDDHDSGGVLLNWGWRYDIVVWFFDTFLMRGEFRQLRQKVLELTHVGAGARLLDVGCGTGTLAIEAARLVGPGVQVAGIDPAPRQIAWAKRKARRAAMVIDFRTAAIQDLPFDDGSFDAVTSTLMMHHLPAEVKAKGLAEIHRVLKPKARLVIADLDTSSGDAGHRHGHQGERFEGGNLTELIAEAGLTNIATDHIPFPRKVHGSSGMSLTCATKPEARDTKEPV